MTSPQELLTDCRKNLINNICIAYKDNHLQSHSYAFAMKLMGKDFFEGFQNEFSYNSELTVTYLRYEGFPAIAKIGFDINEKSKLTDEIVKAFNLALQKQQTKIDNELFADSIAILGIANGINQIEKLQPESSNYSQIKSWFINSVEQKRNSNNKWLNRICDLACDLLDGRKRLRASVDFTDSDSIATEMAFRNCWPDYFAETITPNGQIQENLLKTFLTSPMPSSGDLEKAAIWLKALDQIIDFASQSLTPSISDTVRILSNIQYSFKKWRWEEEPRRKNTMPTQWLIDNEYDVQALLWAVLWPIYGADLVDERYLPDWGNTQARIDLGIKKLKLIIEVKRATSPSDFPHLEEQISGDLGLYFKDISQFDKMIVFIYDDSDKPQIEKYGSFIAALENRDRIEKVIIMQRPSKIPNRSDREYKLKIKEKSTQLTNLE